jgi:RNA polymerase sigma-70 factor (ECF subfamily)
LKQEEENISAIISGCQKGKRLAQEQLYKSFYKVMIQLCIRYTKDDSDAVEVLNNGFLKVFKNINKYDSRQGTVYTWIRKIIINSCLDFIRSKQNLAGHAELDESVEVHIEPEVIKKMKAAALLGLVRQLPPATRAVFNLYVIEGYAHKEVGKLLNISEGTSKWHLSEARKTLQKLIQQQDVKIYE